MPSEDVRRLLIVEDDVETLSLLRGFFSHPRVRVETATNGVEALEKAASFRPDAVLLDALLPLMDGFEVFSRLRPAGAGPEIVLVSGHVSPGVFDFAKTLGAFACFQKPYDLVELRKIVFRALGFEDVERAAGTRAT